jgi:serine/threonine protein kinase
MREQSIFIEALEKEDPAEREAFLDRACAADPALRPRIERLFRRHEQADDVLDAPPAWAAATIDQPIAEDPGTRIGPYKLLEQIGEGGMGAVYVAEQSQPVRRRVALKLIKLGMDTKQVIARFEAERQALAMMDYPNIAKVLDAGSTDTGRPYFVMELIRGIPITEYCDREQLAIPERLELFAQVCRAVQHAHQKGIIHRDLKPSNVLVTVVDGAAVPKVIDFGVAKATGGSLTDRTLFTGIHQLVGTPLYMSPEQADLSSMDIDTRSDIYSLGVLLYELLTGTTPFDAETIRNAAFDEMRRILCEQEPPRPSTRLSGLTETLTNVSSNRKSDPRQLNRDVRGELDWIAMKALAKDRRRRYETANDLAADVMRYLADQPVEACPPSARYRFSKYARRNRSVLTTAFLVGLALVAGTGASLWQAALARGAQHRAEAARDRAGDAEARARSSELNASREATSSREIKQFLQRDLLQQVRNKAQFDDGFAPNSELTVKEALHRAATRIGDRFQGQPLVEAEIRMTIAEAFRGVGEYSAAAEHLGKAYALRQAELGQGHADTLRALDQWAIVCREAGRFTESLDLYARLVELCKTDADSQPADLAVYMGQYGFTCELAGRLSQADELIRESLRITREHNLPTRVYALGRLARNLLLQQRPAEAELLAREALELQEKTNPFDSTTYVAKSLLGGALLGQRKFSEAEPLLVEGYVSLKRLEPSLDVSSSWRLREALDRLVQYYDATNQPEKAAGLRCKIPPQGNRSK